MTNFEKGGGGGGLKREDLIGTLDVQIRYNVSSLFATGCSYVVMKALDTNSVKNF